MALPDFLTAFSRIVLETRADWPADAPTRERRMRAIFPDLGPDELARLAAMPPERLEVYRHTIYSGIRSQLLAAIPASLAALDQASRETGRDGFDLYAELPKLQRLTPWPNHSTRRLLRGFQTYLAVQYPDDLLRFPCIADLVEMECTATEVFLAPDPAHRPLDPDTLRAWVTRSVGELLEAPAFLPPHAALRRFTCDAPALRDAWRRDQRWPSPWPPPEEAHYAAGRHHLSLAVRWTRLTPPQADTLAALALVGPFTLGQLADACAERDPAVWGDPSEPEQAFQRYFAWALSLFENGVLLQPE